MASPVLRGFIARHWRGDYPLGIAYWIFGSLLTVVIVALTAASNSLDLGGELGPRGSGLVIVAFYVFAVTVTTWQLVGIWRSASRHTQRGGRAFWAGLVKVMVVLGVLRAVGDFSSQGVHVVTEGARLLAGIEDTPPHVIRVLRDGAELELSGGMPFGTAEAVERALEANPGVRVLHLNSQGGRMNEANRLREIIAKRGLITYASADCVSACALAFLAGRERFLGERGRLGFHSVSIGELDGGVAKELNDGVRQLMSAHGVPRDFTERALSTPASEMWYPSPEDLLRARVVDAIVDSRYYGLSGVSQWRDAHRIESALLEVPLYAALARFDRDNYAEVRNILVAGIQQGRAVVDIQRDIRSLVVGRMIPEYLKTAPDEALIRYMRSQVAEMRHLAKVNPRHCVDFAFPEFATSELDLSRLISKELQKEDLAALAEVVEGVATNPQAPGGGAAARRHLETVIARAERLQPGLSKVLGDPAGHRHRPGLLCDAVVTLYSQILAMPQPERSGAILRYMFSG